MTFSRIFPAKLYEGIGGEVTKIFTAIGSLTAATSNTLVSAVTGKRIRVHGWSAQTEAGAANEGSYAITDGSGGSGLSRLHYAPKSTVGEFDKPFIDAGYFETTTGTALGVTTAISNIKIEIHYSIYTPD